ncbi:hypothetical protein [Streptomyces sparsogenes]|uniref:Uncharacterized protein n=1 Tax=Streptomyces sparsogenes DSM 40356 TaxID=1331668 RepID=A0A1R1S8A5_9ACTN|nr:hypothetical protein [Streptomyces sparsogenes]OMI34428.1 hypothetical protein SPAR_36631 [Streptomyces sparsogenes DSM 40356]
MSSENWTIDSIAHALPHPELRATFQREVSFTDVGKLPAIFRRWVQFIEDFEADRPRTEELLSYIEQHGRLLDDYDEDTPESIAAFEDLKARLNAHREGHHAA